MAGLRRLVSLGLFLIFGLATVSSAQTFRGGISGRISDTSGGVLPGVAVTATNNATGGSASTTSSDSGDFSCPDLPLGTYTGEAALAGCQTLKVTVEVTVSRISALDLKMGLSQVSETVQVSAGTLLLDTVSTALSN